MISISSVLSSHHRWRCRVRRSLLSGVEYHSFGMRRLIAVVVLIFCNVPAVSLGVTTEELIERLRSGGHVLFIAHAEARTRNAKEFVTPPGCPPGTRLTQQGWQNALAAGRGLMKQGVRVEEVYASPVCAVRHTAYLLFGADKARLDVTLTMDCAAQKPLFDAYSKQLTRRLSTSPRHPEANVAIVGHVCGLEQIVANKWPRCARTLEPGDAVVFKPSGTKFRALGCIPFATLEAWSRRSDLP